ncbi:MAG: AsmA-like C-terminal region-containing protein [Candidatus Acidiferrales bacterium]
MNVAIPNPESPLLNLGVSPPTPPSRRYPRSRRRIRIFLIVIAAFFLFDYGLSILLESGWLHRSLTLRLEAAFGRPVEVSHYSFSLLEGPRLEANYITVGEDPRFGHEYFLRADQVAVSPRWSALFRGKIELGALSITRPSLNLVRLPDGEWNLESWLPRPRAALPPAPGTYRPSARPARLEVSGGRIDFKEGNNKLPFAFVAVEGTVQQTSAGSWRLDLRAQPFRAAVDVQQAGELSLSGVVGGTSSRLRPASLELDWDAASLSDVLRLFRGDDYGMRGFLSLQLKAQTHGYDWNFSSAAQFRRLHRWDLPLRPDDPAANLNVQAAWHPSDARLELTRAVMEMPRSSIYAAGMMTFTPAQTPEQASIKDEHLKITSRSLVFADVLSWYRAFHRNVAEQLEVHGSASLDLTLAGWPPRIENGEIDSVGAEADGGSTPVQMRMEKASLTFLPNSVTLQPVVLSVGAGNGVFRLQASMSRAPEWHSLWKLGGRTPEVRSLFDAAEAWGFNLPPGWLLDGPVECDLQWTGNPWPALHKRSGVITLNGLKVHAPFLNRDITQVKASIDLSPQGDKVQLASANAFAADWHGSLQRTLATGDWSFTLSASQLSAAEMDRWLNPERRENLVDRLLPFLASQPQPPQPMPIWLRGRGALSIGQFALSSFQFRQLHADASVDGRHLSLTNAQAGFYGGTLSGSMALDLSPDPTYNVVAQFRDVNLGLLAARTFSLSDLFAGAASGQIRLAAKGLGRDALLRSLACQGNARVLSAAYNAMDLMESVQASVRRPGVTTFPRAAAVFSCANGRVSFSRLQLQSPRGDFAASGYVDFDRRIAFEILPASADPPPGSDPVIAPVSPAVYRLEGSLNAPQIVRVKSGTTVHP